MKKAIFTLAVFAMAFGNVGFAQKVANLRASELKMVMSHYGLRAEGDLPETAVWRNTSGYEQKRIYRYDECDFYLTEMLEQAKIDGNWVNDELVTYDYGFDGEVLEVYDKAWYEEDWYEIGWATYTYGQDEMDIVYQFREIGEDWQNYLKEVYNYNGSVTTVLLWTWNGNTWSSSELHTYTYGDTSVDVLKQYMQGGAWQNDEKDTYTLDFDGHVTEILIEDWQNNTWVNEKKVSYYFETGSPDYDVREEFDWENGAWVQNHRSSYSYQDGNAYAAYCVRLEDGEFVVVNGELEMAYGHNTNSESFVGCEIEMTYVDVTGIGESPQTTNFKLYPVPAENEIQIQSESFQKAEIYSITGQKLMESNVNTFNVSTLSQGVYLLKVCNLDGNSETQRIVVK